ncbi:aminopeptidase [Polyrhizophydium stewartii]|uniref:Aminopeptidase n=1 Tax=Polyrhizophydium stewartii TaxID=2732419 RepID=A0ABR4NIK7_9FUNG
MSVSARGAASSASAPAAASGEPTHLGKAFGQPKPDTHPHLLQKHERISRDEYAVRRLQLAKAIGPQAAAVVPGYGLRYATGGIFYPFHQSTNLLYLTGFNEPDCGCIIESATKDPSEHRFLMFVQPADRRTEIWDGPRAGIEGARTHFGATAAYPIEAFEDALRQLNASAATRRLYSDLPLTQRSAGSASRSLSGSADSASGSTPSLLENTHIKVSSSSATHVDKDASVSKMLLGRAELHGRADPFFELAAAQPSSSSAAPGRTFSNPWTTGRDTAQGTTVKPLASLIDMLRLYKSPAEIQVMRQAGRITGRAFVEAMRATKPGTTEHQLSAVLEFHLRMQGADGFAYVPVVAGGRNALTLHYVQNKQMLRDGDLVLVDAGGEYGHYASDVTRTWPVNGKFTAAQKKLYESVLRVQKHIIKQCTEAARTTLDQLQYETAGMLQEEISALLGRPVSMGEMNALYPHHVSHWLGMDVHDTGSVSRSTRLSEGMVVTIEPGLYIPDSPNYPPEFRGVGIRIEDDVAVGGPSTHGAPVILSVDAPKEVVDIEAVMAGIV